MPRTGCHGTHPKAGSCGIGLCHHPPHPGLALLPWSSARTCTGSEYGSGGAVPFCRSFCRVCPRSSELAGGRGGTCALAAAYRQPGHHAVLSLASASPGRSKTVRLRTSPKLLTPPSGSACSRKGMAQAASPAPQRQDAVFVAWHKTRICRGRPVRPRPSLSLFQAHAQHSILRCTSAPATHHERRLRQWHPAAAAA